MTEIVGITKQGIFQASKSSFLHYEDSAQYSSALIIKEIESIITRNIKDCKNSGIAVMSPLNYL